MQRRIKEMPAKKVTNEDINRMHDLYTLGLTQREIAEKMKLTEPNVQYHLAKPRPVVEDPNEVKEEKALKDRVCTLLERLATKIINKIDDVDDWDLTKPSEILKGATVATEALGMMYALSPEQDKGGGQGATISGETRINLKNLKAIRKLTPEQRKEIFDEL